MCIVEFILVLFNNNNNIIYIILIIKVKEKCILVQVLPQDIEIPNRLKTIVESLRYVTFDKLNTGKKKVHE